MTDEPSPGTDGIDPRYVAARRVLLDALTALAEQSDAVIVAGAQAIYLRTGDGDVAIAAAPHTVDADLFTVAPFTTDGDLALDPARLGDDPALEAAMTGAGFALLEQEGGHVEPGIWIRTTSVDGEEYEVPVDLIVPEGLAGAGRRGARLGAHGNRAARRALGLEAALVDNSPMTIAALEPGDDRSVVTKVAGVAALFVAKLHKLHDRVDEERERRINDKDAADVIRLMQTTSARDVGIKVVALSQDEIAGAVSTDALTYIEELFGTRGRPGIQMAARALRLAMPDARVEALAVAYTAALLRAVAEARSPR